MRITVAIVAASALMGCHQKSHDPKIIFACMKAQGNVGDYEVVTRCEPLEPSRIYEGTWFVAFEASNFQEGKPDPSLPVLYNLIAPDEIQGVVHAKDSIADSTFHVVFMGRRSLISGKPDHDTIVLDKIVSIHRIGPEPTWKAADARRRGDEFVAAMYGIDDLSRYDVRVEDKSDRWEVTYTPKGEATGGPQTIAVNKRTGGATSVRGGQ